MKKKAGIGVISLLISAFFALPSHAATVTASGDATGLCTQTIDSVA
jgi:hypothetical protein